MATKVTHTAEFLAPCNRVIAALADEGVIQQVLRESESLDPVVEVRQSPGHLEVHVRRGFTADWPALVAGFVGERVDIEEERRWQQTSETSWEGTLSLRVVGKPIEFSAQLSLTEVAGKTTLSMNGLVRCSVPLVGGALEKMAADLVSDAFAHEVEVSARVLG